MNRFYTIVIFIMSIFFCSNVDGQTYYYEITSKVEKNTGVKQSYYSSIYITFSKGKNICYQSKKDGSQISAYGSDHIVLGVNIYQMDGTYSSDNIFRYASSQDGMKVYSCRWSFSPYRFLPGATSSNGIYYALFSSDFKRINIDQGRYVYVGEIKVEPGEAKAPTQMW